MYSIKITYSWGDEEPLVGKYGTKEEAFREACLMAGKEAYVQNEEFEEDRIATIYVDASHLVVSLTYQYDGETCFYNIVDAEES